MIKYAFYFMLKLFSLLKYLHFCPDFCGQPGERLGKRAKVNFKTYDFKDLTTNKFNTHPVQYLKK